MKTIAGLMLMALGVGCGGPSDGEVAGSGGSPGSGGAAGAPIATGGAGGDSGGGPSMGGMGGNAPWEPKCPNGSYLTGGSHWLYLVDVWDQYSGHVPPGEYVCAPVSPDELCVYRVPDGDADGASDGAWPYPQNPAECY